MTERKLIVKKLLAGVLALAVPSLSFAAFDGTDVAAAITGNAAGLALVGAAILGVVYTVRAFSWAKKI